MKFVGFRRVKFSSVKMDVADIRRRSKQPHVVELADNIRDTADEPINVPLVRVEGHRASVGDLVAGRDRMAALLLLKAQRIWIRLVECSDEEAADLKASENIYRRSVNRAQELADAVAAKEALHRARRGTAVPLGAQRQSNNIKAQARSEVAKTAGIQPASVKKAEQRAKKSSTGSGHGAAGDPPTPPPSQGSETPGPVDELPPPCIDLLGTPRAAADDSSLLAECAEIQKWIDRAAQHLSSAQAALKGLEMVTGNSSRAQRLHEQVHRVASLVRSERPASICPWCKGLAQQIPDCPGCHGFRWVSAERAKGAPRECLDAVLPVVCIDGGFWPYPEVAAHNGIWRRKQANGAGKRMRVEDEAGNELVTEYDE